MEQKANTFLETERLGKLMVKYAVPCVISLLVAALYNIVDQIFIANADYLGSYGNAANTVVFPLTVVALSIAVMIGDGCCAFVSISLGRNGKEAAHKSIGSAVLLCIVSGLIMTVIYLVLQEPILTLFGGRATKKPSATQRNIFSGSPWVSRFICSVRHSIPSSAPMEAPSSPWPLPWRELPPISFWTPSSSLFFAGE